MEISSLATVEKLGECRLFDDVPPTNIKRVMLSLQHLARCVELTIGIKASISVLLNTTSHCWFKSFDWDNLGQSLHATIGISNLRRSLLLQEVGLLGSPIEEHAPSLGRPPLFSHMVLDDDAQPPDMVVIHEAGPGQLHGKPWQNEAQNDAEDRDAESNQEGAADGSRRELLPPVFRDHESCHVQATSEEQELQES